MASFQALKYKMSKLKKKKEQLRVQSIHDEQPETMKLAALAHNWSDAGTVIIL